MKELIVSSVIIVILLSFPLQSMLDTANTSTIEIFESIVRAYADKARLEGYFTDEIISDMILEIATKVKKVDASDITYSVTTVPKYRTIDHYDERELIEYSVTIPIKNAFIGGIIFGQEENLTYTCSGNVISERLP